MRVAPRAIALAIATTVCMPASAQAATTVGSSLRQRANLYVRCNGTCTAAQSARPGGAGLTIPSDGVITRWRVRAATMGMVRLRVLRHEPGGGYTAVAAGAWSRLDRPHEPGHDVLYEFPAQIVVHAGDLIGLDRDSKAGGIFHSYADNSAYAVAEFAPALAVDAFDIAPSSNASGRELLLNVDIEKDEDGDTFGDESQDNCPTIPNDQSTKPCTTPTPQPTTPQGATSTPVETTPETHTRGSEGPPVAGERPLAKERRRHSSRRRARRGPPKARDPQRTHGRRRNPRSAPRGPTRKEGDGHGVAPRPRPKPVAPRRHAVEHERSSPRPHPPKPRTPSGESHERAPARPAPRTDGKRQVHTHRTRKGARLAPHPKHEPGWQHHNV